MSQVKDFTPIPESEQEKRIKKDIDFLDDMYNDDDYHKYIWYLGFSKDGGKTFEQVDGHVPVGMEMGLKSKQAMAPISTAFIIQPVVYPIAGVSASAWEPPYHPVNLYKASRNGETIDPEVRWEAPNDGSRTQSMTIDLGEERVIGAIEISTLKAGKYHYKIGTSSDPINFLIRGQYDIENLGPATNIVLSYLVEGRYVQILTTCKAITQIRILSMSENATTEEKEMLSKQFYEQKAMAMRRYTGRGKA